MHGAAIALVAGYVLGYFWCRVISRPTTKSQHKKEIKKARLETKQLRAQCTRLEGKVQQLTTQLSSASLKLETEIANSPLDKRQLQERVKHLNCFYGLSRLVNRPQTSLDQICQETAELIRNAYQYPDITRVRITLDGVQYKTNDFRKSELSQYAQINVCDDKAGSVEVYYVGEPHKGEQGPFLEEERDLLDAVAEHLGRVVERKQTAEKLELFRNLTDRSNDCILVMEPEWGRFLDVNEKACESLGYTRRELVSMSIKDIEESIPDDSSLQEYIKELKLKREAVKESQHRRKDGTEFSVETSLKYISQKKGNYIIAVARDINDRKRAEEEIRKRQELLTSIISNIPHCVFWKDRQSVYLGCNENFARVAGVETPADIVGKTDYDLAWKKDEADWFIICDKEVMEREEPLINIEESQLQSDGKEATLLSSRVPRKDQEENVIGLLGIYADITERKQAEKTLELAYVELEKANGELKETQSQLVQSEKLASIGQLAAGVAHEMNTPVGFVASNFQTLEGYVDKFQHLFKKYGELMAQIEPLQETELLDKAHDIARSRDEMKMDFVIEDIQDLFKDSKEGLQRVTSIIQNLRDFSRIDQAEEFAEYNLNDGIKATLVVANNEIKYDCDIETEFSKMPAVLCNSGQMNQVFLNILVNAAQAIKSQERQNKGTITIRTCATDTQVVCEISDDGPGIHPDKVSKIFDPFFTTKPVGKGTGLGLSVSYDIVVNKHKGQLLVDSAVGKGAKFTIKLPIKRENQSDQKEITSNGNQSGAICGR
jgi:PAS domain S-box-containing protein